MVESRVFDVEVVVEGEEGGEKRVRLKLLQMHVIIWRVRAGTM